MFIRIKILHNAIITIEYIRVYRHQMNMCRLYTVLSRPRVISMRKKMMAQKTDPVSVAMASGYTTNTRPAPTMGQQLCTIDAPPISN